MPIYEYECPKCGSFEVVQKAGERAVKCDPDCKRADCPKSAKKVISAAAFHLKGSGWYKTDYAGKTSTQGAASAGDSDSGKKPKGDAATTSPGASESKSADKKEAKPASCGSGCGCHK